MDLFQVRTNPESLCRAVVIASLLGALLVGCTTNRYVGSVGRDGTYANRGYGVALRVRRDGLEGRWKLLDPAKLPEKPTPGLPVPSRAPLDLDGDGMLSVHESTLHFAPTLRLLSRTSTGARADIRVKVLSGPAKDVGLDPLLRRAFRLWAKVEDPVLERAAQSATVETVGGRPARVATATTAVALHHMAVIDQGLVRSEERIRRRQLVTVYVYAPIPPAETVYRDFRAFLQALILSRVTGRESVLERW